MIEIRVLRYGLTKPVTGVAPEEMHVSPAIPTAQNGLLRQKRVPNTRRASETGSYDFNKLQVAEPESGPLTFAGVRTRPYVSDEIDLSRSYYKFSFVIKGL